MHRLRTHFARTPEPCYTAAQTRRSAARRLSFLPGGVWRPRTGRGTWSPPIPLAVAHDPQDALRDGVVSVALALRHLPRPAAPQAVGAVVVTVRAPDFEGVVRAEAEPRERQSGPVTVGARRHGA